MPLPGSYTQFSVYPECNVIKPYLKRFFARQPASTIKPKDNNGLIPSEQRDDYMSTIQLVKS